VGGFAPVRRDVLLRLAEMDHVTDSEIVREQRAGMLDPSAPNPSVEAILHALVPYRFVDHTHADPVLTISNTPRGPELIRELYGERVLVLPYVMAGFKLAKAFYHATRGIDWSALDAMILLHHGIFTFADEARQSYDRMIALVSQAEDYLRQQGALDAIARAAQPPAVDLEALCRDQARRLPGGRAADAGPVGNHAGKPGLRQPAERGRSDFARQPDARSRQPHQAHPGPHRRRHRGRHRPFRRRLPGLLRPLRRTTAPHARPGPRWGVWRGIGTLAFGPTVKNTETYADIARHTVQAIQQPSTWAVGGCPARITSSTWNTGSCSRPSSNTPGDAAPPGPDRAGGLRR
jgi:rhamnose utilization protein RhaD (predicted bifunctional aldolase and dehydrogenase)